MERGFLKGMLFCLGGIFITACGNDAGIVGSWTQPVPGMEYMEQGFTLRADGNASSIDMATLQYEKWERKGNLLILSGKSIGNGQTLSFTDTLKIEKLTRDSLIFKNGELVSRYVRTDGGQAGDAMPASTANKSLSVKGELIIGHEVRSFTATGDSFSYWIVDQTGGLMRMYDETTGGVKNGTPVYVELEVADEGPSDEGFAADYAGVYRVTKIGTLRAE